MLHTFEPRYAVPDRKTFSQNYIPEMYQCEKTRIVGTMKRDVKNFSLTTDGWTSRANHSYISHTVCIILLKCGTFKLTYWTLLKCH